MQCNLSTPSARTRPSVGPVADMRAVAAFATNKTTTITG